MRKLTVFENVTLNGHFAGPEGDLSWAYERGADPEFQEFVQGNASEPSVLLFGRVTYQMMASYWPTPLATENDPRVAKGMNEAEKIVFSRTLSSAEWENTRFVCGDLPDEVRALKQEANKDLVVLGSGSIVSQLASADLIDEYQIVLNPVVLGSGRTLFEGVKKPLSLQLTSSRAFENGSLVLSYAPAK